MLVRPQLSYLSYLDSRAAYTAAYKSRPYSLPTLRFPGGYLPRGAQFSLFVGPTVDDDHRLRETVPRT